MNQINVVVLVKIHHLCSTHLTLDLETS